MDCLWAALGLALVFEGIPWFLSPRGSRRTLLRLARMPETGLRLLGLALMGAGLALVWFGTRG